MSKYLEFKELDYKGKTKKFHIISKRSGDILRKIYWWGAWRQYIFEPTLQTVWNKDCLQSIQDFIQDLMFRRKLSKKWNENLKECFNKDGKCLTCGTQGELVPGIGYYCPNKKCEN